jgi:hypothetical protein
MSSEDLSQTKPGIAEVVRTMVLGEKRTIWWAPAELAEGGEPKTRNNALRTPLGASREIAVVLMAHTIPA